jgi:hypothetical protein
LARALVWSDHLAAGTAARVAADGVDAR